VFHWMHEEKKGGNILCGWSTYAAECVPLFDFLLIISVFVYKKSLNFENVMKIWSQRKHGICLRVIKKISPWYVTRQPHRCQVDCGYDFFIKCE
jgi:hypothetical protein